MKRAVSIAVLLALFTVTAGWGQQVASDQYIFHAEMVSPLTRVSGNATGVLGATTLYYWVAVRYPIGVSVQTAPAVVPRTRGIANLGASPVVLSWTAVPGATGYDLIRLTTSRWPTTSTCVACVVSSDQAGTTFTDNTGVSVVAWPPAGTVFAKPVNFQASINNRDDDYPFIQWNGEYHIFPTRSTNAYSYLFEIGGLMTGGAVQKTYALGINVTRPDTAIATGDSNDAIIRGSYSNYAKNDANFIIRGVNTSITNRSPGTLGVTEGGNVSAANRSGATSPQVRGMMLSVENYGVVADQFSGLTVAMKNEAAKATLEYGVKVQNDNNSVATAADAAYMVRSSAGLANLGFQYGLDMNGATLVEDIRLKTGAVIRSGNGAPAADCAAPIYGSIYMNLAGGVNTSLYICQAAGAWAAVTP